MAWLPPIAILVIIRNSSEFSFPEFELISIPFFAIYETPTIKCNKVFSSMRNSLDIFQRVAKF